jgi:hypothetical protein
MQTLLAFLLAAALSGPAWCSDLVVTKEKHTDAATLMGQSQPAQDSQEVTWIGKDRLRMQEGDRVTIVRTDLKKMFLLDTKAKTFSALDLPLDMKKYLPAEMAPMMEMMGQMKVTVTPTAETKKIKDWNATRYTLTTSMPMGGSSTQEMWVTKEIGVDPAAWQEMFAALLSVNPMGGGMAGEMKKVDGFPVLVEHTQKIMNSEIKSREAVLSVEQKEAPADFYDVPKDYTEKPFDPMAGMMAGHGGHAGRRK